LDTVPVLSVLAGAVTVVLLTAALLRTAEVLPEVADTLVAVVLLLEAEDVLATLFVDTPESLRLTLLLEVPPRVDTLLVKTLSELLW
jgi:hypothetical protein